MKLAVFSGFFLFVAQSLVSAAPVCYEIHNYGKVNGQKQCLSQRAGTLCIDAANERQTSASAYSASYRTVFSGADDEVLSILVYKIRTSGTTPAGDSVTTYYSTEWSYKQQQTVDGMPWIKLTLNATDRGEAIIGDNSRCIIKKQ